MFFPLLLDFSLAIHFCKESRLLRTTEKYQKLRLKEGNDVHRRKAINPEKIKESLWHLLL